MEKLNLLVQGAEAKVYEYKDMIIKYRFKKTYRFEDLDLQIREKRTKLEKKIMQKLTDAGIKVPQCINYYEEDINSMFNPKTTIYMERINSHIYISI